MTYVNTEILKMIQYMLNLNTNNIIPIQHTNIYAWWYIHVIPGTRYKQWRDKRNRKYAHFQHNTSTDRLVAIIYFSGFIKITW